MIHLFTNWVIPVRSSSTNLFLYTLLKQTENACGNTEENERNAGVHKNQHHLQVLKYFPSCMTVITRTTLMHFQSVSFHKCYSAHTWHCRWFHAPSAPRERPKKRCCLVNAEYWLRVEGREGVKGSWVKVLKPSPFLSWIPRADTPQPLAGDSSNYRP